MRGGLTGNSGVGLAHEAWLPVFGQVVEQPGFRGLVKISSIFIFGGRDVVLKYLWVVNNS
jgi:hypothetical protein